MYISDNIINKNKNNNESAQAKLSVPNYYINKKFVASFSAGKDSMLAIYRCIKQGMAPIGMITTCPVDVDKSWFHKVDKKTLNEISNSINIPITFVKTSGEEYQINFENALFEAKQNGAEIIVFGDIDIDEHLEWCSQRCKRVGITPYFPLWKEDRERIVREFIDAGFKAKIVVVKDERLSTGFLGEILTHELLNKIVALGVDICGENGEYHTLVIDGPIFDFPISAN